MHPNLLIVPLIALLIAGCATSKVQKDKTSPDRILVGEKLIAQPPTNWQNIYSLNKETTRLTDFIPPEEAKDNWSTKLSFESHQALVEVDPITIVMGDLDNTNDICDFVQSFNLFSGLENHYPTSVRLTFCGKNAHTERGEVTMTKSIQGNEYLYIIKMLMQVEPFTADENDISKQQIATWSQYFGDITVCDDTLPKHACPSQ